MTTLMHFETLTQITPLSPLDARINNLLKALVCNLKAGDHDFSKCFYVWDIMIGGY